MIAPTSNTHQIHIPFGLRPLSQYPLHLVSYISSNLSFLIPIFSLFLYPLYRSKKFTAPLREVARGALWTALVALATSVTQAAIMTALDGQELGWICLGSCDADVTINALALFLFTHLYDQEPIDTVTQPVMCPQSAMPILDTTSEHQQGKISCPFASFQCEGTFVNSMKRRAHISPFYRVRAHETSWPVCDYR